MARNDRTTAGPYWTRNWIEKMWRFTAENFVNFDTGDVDFEALGREEYEFRKALFYRNFKHSERAKEAFVESEDLYKVNVERGKKGGRPKKIPQDAPNGNAGVDMSDAGNGAASKSPTSCGIYEQAGNPLTRESETRGPQTDNNSGAVKASADGDIREDSLAEPDGSAITRNETRAHDALEPSASIYGDAATREGADESTTVSRNSDGPRQAKNGESADDPQPEGLTGPSHGGSVASLEARQVQARESRRAGGNSLRVAKVSTSPARSSGPMPEDKQAVYDFAAAEGLDTADAYECWQVTVNERDGRTADGKPIKNWKAYVRKWCETRAKRRTA